MSTDLALVLGLVVIFFSLPAIISAWSDRRAPRAPMMMILIGGGLIIFAVTQNPGGYSIAQVPDVFFGVIRQLMP
ncbi:MAG: hypothetical protein MRY77_20275 [Rhodobacteraceae bacterium]|jgi:hypothetical protein|nr:hypothetical protein [Paracoccaceae bacterium]